MPRIQLCRTSEVVVGEALKVQIAGLDLAVFHVGEQYFVTSDGCTHGPGSLSEGILEGEVIECNFHQGRFNVRTGEAVAPPCTIPLRTYPPIIDNGVIYIDVQS